MRKACPHPFAAHVDALREVLELDVGQAAVGAADLQLPSRRRSPLDSPELVRLTPRRASKEEPRLLTWTVPVLRLDPAGALSWLTSDGDVDGDARTGASVTWQRDLSRFAVELVERGGPGVSLLGMISC